MPPSGKRAIYYYYDKRERIRANPGVIDTCDVRELDLKTNKKLHVGNRNMDGTQASGEKRRREEKHTVAST
jgi:hypothetical protein